MIKSANILETAQTSIHHYNFQVKQYKEKTLIFSSKATGESRWKN